MGLAGHSAAVGDANVCGDIGAIAGDLGGMRADTGTAMVHHVDMQIACGHQSDRTIQPAMHEKVAGQRQDIGGRAARDRLGVIHPDREQVLRAGTDRRCNIDAKARKSALMVPDLDAVDPDFGVAAGGVELEPEPLALHDCGR